MSEYWLSSDDTQVASPQWLVETAKNNTNLSWHFRDRAYNARMTRDWRESMTNPEMMMKPNVDDLIKQTQWRINHNAGQLAWKAGFVRDLSDKMKRATEALDTEEMQRYSGRLVEMARSLESDRRALMWEMKLNETLIEIVKVRD